MVASLRNSGYLMFCFLLRSKVSFGIHSSCYNPNPFSLQCLRSFWSLDNLGSREIDGGFSLQGALFRGRFFLRRLFSTVYAAVPWEFGLAVWFPQVSCFYAVVLLWRFVSLCLVCFCFPCTAGVLISLSLAVVLICLFQGAMQCLLSGCGAVLLLHPYTYVAIRAQYLRGGWARFPRES
jgi:hypothetical protein